MGLKIVLDSGINNQGVLYLRNVVAELGRKENKLPKIDLVVANGSSMFLAIMLAIDIPLEKIVAFLDSGCLNKAVGVLSLIHFGIGFQKDPIQTHRLRSAINEFKRFCRPFNSSADSITFRDSKINIVGFGCEYSNRLRPMCFSKYTTGDLALFTALEASCSVFGVHKPVSVSKNRTVVQFFPFVGCGGGALVASAECLKLACNEIHNLHTKQLVSTLKSGNKDITLFELDYDRPDPSEMKVKGIADYLSATHSRINIPIVAGFNIINGICHAQAKLSSGKYTVYRIKVDANMNVFSLKTGSKHPTGTKGLRLKKESVTKSKLKLPKQKVLPYNERDPIIISILPPCDRLIIVPITVCDEIDRILMQESRRRINCIIGASSGAIAGSFWYVLKSFKFTKLLMSNIATNDQVADSYGTFQLSTIMDFLPSLRENLSVFSASKLRKTLVIMYTFIWIRLHLYYYLSEKYHTAIDGLPKKVRKPIIKQLEKTLEYKSVARSFVKVFGNVEYYDGALFKLYNKDNIRIFSVDSGISDVLWKSRKVFGICPEYVKIFCGDSPVAVLDLSKWFNLIGDSIEKASAGNVTVTRYSDSSSVEFQIREMSDRLTRSAKLLPNGFTPRYLEGLELVHGVYQIVWKLRADGYCTDSTIYWYVLQEASSVVDSPPEKNSTSEETKNIAVDDGIVSDINLMDVIGVKGLKGILELDYEKWSIFEFEKFSFLDFGIFNGTVSVDSMGNYREKKELVVTYYDVENEMPRCVSSRYTPKAKFVDNIVASSSIPFFFGDGYISKDVKGLDGILNGKNLDYMPNILPNGHRVYEYMIPEKNFRSAQSRADVYKHIVISKPGNPGYTLSTFVGVNMFQENSNPFNVSMVNGMNNPDDLSVKHYVAVVMDYVNMFVNISSGVENKICINTSEELFWNSDKISLMLTETIVDEMIEQTERQLKHYNQLFLRNLYESVESDV